MRRRHKRGGEGQAAIEYTFGLVAAVVLLMGMVQVAMWVGPDLAARTSEHERTMTLDVHGLNQTNPDFYYATPIFAAVESNIFGDEF